MLQVSGATQVKTTFALQHIPQQVLDHLLAGEHPVQRQFANWSLYSLPLPTQQVYRLLLVVPMGILVLVLIRNVVGLKTLGTFMPALIALALHSTNLIWGVTLFVGIVATGLLFRMYLENLKLLLVPRLAAVLTFVIILMTVLSLATHMMGFAQGLSVALFPMVIMTMTIERLSVLWDESGANEAIRRALGTLIISVLLSLLISIPLFEHLFFTFPELLLVLMASMLLLGRYTGYRLLELSRFSEFKGAA